MALSREERLKRKADKERELALAQKLRAEKFMRLAIKQAIVAEKKGEVPIGAVIVRGDEVIARAHNLRETMRLATAHAEILALQRACKKVGDWRLNGCDIFVTLEPCTMCAGAIANARIDNVYFGAYEKKGGACGSVRNVLENTGLNSNVCIHPGVMEEECSLMLKKFFANRRNKVD